jgi:hypothetical protein
MSLPQLSAEIVRDVAKRIPNWIARVDKWLELRKEHERRIGSVELEL